MPPSPDRAALDHEVAIVGSGFSGIGAAIKLRKIGIRDFVVLERAEDIGGTWRDHDYPGLTVDMPSFIYCYPFEMYAGWKHVYPRGPEIKAYIDHCVDKYGVRPHLRFGRQVVAAVWDERRTGWVLQLEDGESLAVRYLVSASGLLVEPRLPRIEGIETFEGELFHSGRWKHGCELDGKRVAVVGTGATSVQLIPAIAGRVKRLDVYQRTPIWLMGKPDAPVSEKWRRRFERFPVLQHLVRWAINGLVELTMGTGFVRYKRFPWLFNWLERFPAEQVRRQVKDPGVAEKLIPEYSFFCKRPSFSNEYYACFNRDDVELVTDPIERIDRHAVVVRGGRARETDVLICATGYSVFDRSCTPNFEVIGRGGRNLGDFWQAERFQAYEGASVPGFPNFFLMMGPYSAAGASYFTMIDTQARHLARCLRRARRTGTNYVEVRPEAHARDFAKVELRRRGMVLFAGHCAGSNSYYFDEHGDAPGLRPVTGLEHWWKSLRFPLRDYVFECRPHGHTTGPELERWESSRSVR